MKYGLFLNPQFPHDGDAQASLDGVLAQARAASAAGFESLWLPHHFATYPVRMFDTHTLMARLTAEVPDTTIGPAVLLLPVQNPVFVAEQAATLDWLSGGNYVLAAGLGYRPEEFAIHGAKLSERVGRLVESIEVIRRLWTEDRVTHHGKYYHLDDIGLSMRPVRPEGCPIWIGGGVPAAVRRAARLGDTWIASFSQTIDELHSLKGDYDSARVAAGLGSPPERPVCRECFIGPDGKDALAMCREALLYKYKAYAAWGNTNVGAARFEERFDEFVNERFLIGDSARVRDQMDRLVESTGCDHLLLRMHWPGMSTQESLASIERARILIA
jgi:alkanesulfonate monooxygenase SsuD/methylene tetrahydromethanopterin reductase-like flavin-dependent oxidoreductase (luciferase family)